jgi:acyl-CoA synthetase (AMP-forming)/AMP-acid ligase II
MTGRHTFLPSVFIPDVFLRLVEQVRCAFLMLVPSLYRSLLNEPYLQRMDKSAVKFCVTGGEPCPDALAERIEAAFGVPLVMAYSMTECLSGIGHSRRELFSRQVERGSCGKPLFGEVSLRDAQGRPQLEEGELWVRNATVHVCYLDEAMNEDRFRNGWFRTGDLFFKDEDGNFFHRGRADDMFVCNGKNIYPAELEQLLMRHPDVDLACAAPVSMAAKGPVPAVAVSVRRAVRAAELQEFCMLNGPSHAVPQLVLFLETLPIIGPGKIDRQRVGRLLQQACESRTP